MEGEKYLFVVAGPSGVGKDSVMAKVRAAHPEIEKTVSITTRAPREGEVDGSTTTTAPRNSSSSCWPQGRSWRATASMTTTTAP